MICIITYLYISLKHKKYVDKYLINVEVEYILF